MMNKKTESGQAIVLLVFAVVGLIGFTALAIWRLQDIHHSDESEPRSGQTILCEPDHKSSKAMRVVCATGPVICSPKS